MNRIGKIAGTVALGAVALTACGGGSTPTVDGRQDDVKHVTKKTRQATRTVPDYRQECQTKTRTKSSGTGTKRRTWTETYQDCNRVRSGSHQEAYTKVVRKERWCVELDDVNGKRSDDDVWFTVSGSTYHEATDRNEGAKVTDMPYTSRGC